MYSHKTISGIVLYFLCSQQSSVRSGHFIFDQFEIVHRDVHRDRCHAQSPCPFVLPPFPSAHLLRNSKVQAKEHFPKVIMPEAMIPAQREIRLDPICAFLHTRQQLLIIDLHLNIFS